MFKAVLGEGFFTLPLVSWKWKGVNKGSEICAFRNIVKVSISFSGSTIWCCSLSGLHRFGYPNLWIYVQYCAKILKKKLKIFLYILLPKSQTSSFLTCFWAKALQAFWRSRKIFFGHCLSDLVRSLYVTISKGKGFYLFVLWSFKHIKAPDSWFFLIYVVESMKNIKDNIVWQT